MAASSNSLKNPPEPAWVSLMPAAAGLWSMILTFRERNSHDVADKLEAAAEKQWEVHLRTRAILNRSEKQVGLETTPRLTNRLSETEVVNSNHHQDNHRSRERTKESALISNVESDHHKDRVTFEKRTDSTSPHNTSVIPEVSPPLVSSATTSPRSLSPNYPIESSVRVPLPEKNNNNVLGYYKQYSSRLKSYEKSKFRWVSPSPSQLSEAGFFFIGPRDKVQCFSCEICHNEWKSCEDPWVRHTRHSPSCDYIMETRGQDFISTILNKVEKVKNGIINTYSRSNSNNGRKSPTGSEFAKMKLRSTKKTTTVSGWQLDPYKEKVVGKKKK